ncbi:MAG: Holliday junction resolvase Hjc [Candidatus Micrarchaeota archaeon]|nr:Holliday junction resolvase Hjc [Candidatus Micrarchaeota archaeon]
MTFGSYRKGTKAENELIDILNSYGFLTIRAAGSGKKKFKCPDVLAFRTIDQYGFECKAIESDYLQLKKEQINSLILWQELTNIATFIAWRKRGGEWYFISPQYLKENQKAYSIDIENAKKYSKPFEEIVKKKI